jgi:hypothetical protein
MAYAWRNCRIGARVIDEASDHVTAQGIFNDVESNTVTTQEVRRRITDKRGRRYSADMINVTANAACAIARRNAILQAIPKPLWADLYQEARRMAAGSEAELGPRRDKAIGAFRDLGVSEARIFAMLGVDNAEQIGLDKLARLRGIYTAVKDGAVSIKEIDAPADKAGQAEQKSALDEFASQTAAPGPDTQASGAGGSNEPPPFSGAAADRSEGIRKLLELAADADLTEQEKLETLDGLQPAYADAYGEDFADTAIETIAKLIRGEIKKPAEAKKYLESLK